METTTKNHKNEIIKKIRTLISNSDQRLFHTIIFIQLIYRQDCHQIITPNNII